MPSLNQCNFIGHLGQDPEVKYTPSGKAVANFSVAVSEKYGGKERTEWVRIVAWDKLAEICGNYLKKGAPVFISGRMQTREWEDKDGNRRFTTEIVAQTMQMLGVRDEGGANKYPQKQQPKRQADIVDDDDGDIPF